MTRTLTRLALACLACLAFAECKGALDADHAAHCADLAAEGRFPVKCGY